jgi:hypothetical protein
MTATDSQVELLPFFCPIPPAIHPDVDVIERNAVEWLDHVHFYRDDAERARLLHTNSAEFYARFAPRGLSHNVEMAAHWVYWGFSFDDTYCDDGPLSERPAEFAALAGQVQRALEAAGNEPGAGDPHVAALQDVARSFHDCATPVQIRRFADAHRAWLSGVAWQVGNVARGHMPDIDEYLAIRLNSAGGPPTLAMLEIANGTEIPAHEFDAPTIRALTEMTCLIAALDNDLHSYHKECDRQSWVQNIIDIVAHQERCARQDAMRQAVAVRDRIMVLFLRLRSRAMEHASEPLHRYLDCLGHSIRGNIDWGLRVPRYTGTESDGVSGATTRSETVDVPSDGSTDALPFSSVSWWWQCDPA